MDAAAPSHLLSGLSIAPRLLRSFHWPSPSPSSPPPSPLLDSTLVAPPLPRPPESVVSDPVVRASLAATPHLFRIDTPINVDRLEYALRDHPNPLWAASIIVGLREGFWPAHSGAAPAPPKKLSLSRCYPSAHEDRDVQVKNARDQVAEGLISPPLAHPPAGGVISPQFVVRREGSKPRVVDDHRASGLNAGVGYAPAVYDRVSDLVSLLRQVGLLKSPLPGAMLYKTDVSNAFKALPMAPEWQLRQIVAVSYPGANGGKRRRVKYHVQHRAAFGSAASPYLWTSFMGAVHWVIASTVPSIPRPLSYMDDSYGLDRSLSLTPHGRAKQLRLVPTALAELLAVWDGLGIPWRWEKVDFGRAIVITGFLISLDEATITLPQPAIDKFAAEVDAFLAEPSREHPLRRWRQLAGWANWALTIRPFARPLLAPLFDKLVYPTGTARKDQPHVRVFINVPVRRALRAFVRELATGAPLDLRDLTLTRWQRADADVLVHTDACLQVDGRRAASGLGFVVEFVKTGEKRYFACRVPLLAKIRYAEALAIASAVEWIVAQTGDLKRVLIRSDAATCVYAFNSGRAKNSPSCPMQLLLLFAFRLLRRRKVDFRVHHIRGAQNRTADDLSRLPLPVLRRRYGASLSIFSPPPALVGRALE